MSYSKKQWNDMENYYMNLLDKEREKNDRLTQTNNILTKSLEVKNNEVEQANFNITNLSIALKMTICQIDSLSKGEKNINKNG